MHSHGLLRRTPYKEPQKSEDTGEVCSAFCKLRFALAKFVNHRIFLLKMLVEIHNEGVDPAKFEASTVLYHEERKKHFIINFQGSYTEHVCECKAPLDIFNNRKMPKVENMGCIGLFDAAHYGVFLWNFSPERKYCILFFPTTALIFGL